MNIRKLPVLTLVFFSGCSSLVNYPDSRAVPEARIGPAYAKHQSTTDDNARIVIVRDSGFVGSGVRARLFINREPLAELYPGQSITLHVQPDEYQLGGLSRIFPVSGAAPEPADSKRQVGRNLL